MSFGKEIYNLLLRHEIVIIPGFGAFVSEYRPAEINEENDEIKPPSKSVSFNPQLKNNDGLLVGHIAEKLHIPHFEALVRIEKERDDLLYKLDAGYDADIEGVGTLFYKEDGVIGFRSKEEENMLLDSFGLDPMSIGDPAPEDPNEEKTEEIIEIPPSATAETLDDGKTDSEKDSKEEKPFNTEGWTKTHQAPQNQPEEHKKKGWLILLILIPLLAVAGFFLLKDINDGSKDKIIHPTEIAKEVPPEQNLPVIDSSATDSITLEKQDTLLAADTTIALDEPMENIVEEEVGDSIRYYVVAGSFSVKENADNYLLELQEKGYDAFHVGKKGRFFIIGLDAYNSFKEAEEAKIQYMKDNPDSEVWVYRK